MSMPLKSGLPTSLQITFKEYYAKKGMPITDDSQPLVEIDMYALPSPHPNPPLFTHSSNPLPVFFLIDDAKWRQRGGRGAGEQGRKGSRPNFCQDQNFYEKHAI